MQEGKSPYWVSRAQTGVTTHARCAVFNDLPTRTALHASADAPLDYLISPRATAA